MAGEALAPARTTRAVAAWARTGCGVAFPVGDATAGEVVGADLHKHLVAGQEFDSKLGELAGCAAQALVTGWLLQGDQVKPVPLLLFDHTGSLNHAAGRSEGSIAASTLIAARQGIWSQRWSPDRAPQPFPHDPPSDCLGSGTAAHLHRRGQPLESPQILKRAPDHPALPQALRGAEPVHAGSGQPLAMPG